MPELLVLAMGPHGVLSVTVPKLHNHETSGSYRLGSYPFRDNCSKDNGHSHSVFTSALSSSSNQLREQGEVMPGCANDGWTAHQHTRRGRTNPSALPMRAHRIASTRAAMMGYVNVRELPHMSLFSLGLVVKIR